MVNLRSAPRKKREDEWQQYGRRDPMTGGTMESAVPEDTAPAKRQSWMDGGKFGWRDGVGLALAGLGDAMSRENGGEGDFMDSLVSRAYSARDLATKAQESARTKAAEREASLQRMAAARPDLNPAQLEALSYSDFTPDQVMPKPPEKDDVFTSMMRHAGIDPESEDGKKLYKQRAETMANPMYQGWDGKRYGGAAAATGSGDGWETVSQEEEAALRKRQGGAGYGQQGFRIPRLR